MNGWWLHEHALFLGGRPPLHAGFDVVEFLAIGERIFLGHQRDTRPALFLYAHYAAAALG